MAKPWAHNTGKVEIGAKWEDPTIDSPILRRLPRGMELSPSEPPRRSILIELSSQLLGPAIFLALAILVGQAIGWL